MGAFQTVTKAINDVRLLLASDKEWKKPERKKVLIFDARTGQPLLNYVDGEHASLLYHWRERANLYVLLRCILSLRLSWLEYARQYISAVSPAAVMTSSDNSATFYQLKAIFPDITTVAVQSSWRGEQADIFRHFKQRMGDKDLRADYVLTYNQEVGQLYRRHVGGKIIPIGSLLNNHFKQTKNVNAKSLVVISEFRPLGAHATDSLKNKNGQQATWQDIYSLERILLPFVADYCAAKGLEMSICGAKNRDQAAEFEFYKNLLGGRKWQWIPRRDWYSNYSVINSAEFVVFVNSTLGYESLARGKKVACLSARGNWFQDSSSWSFGWPSDLPSAGPFWTNHAEVAEFKRVLDYVTSVSDADWIDTWRQFGPRLMVYDAGNSQLVSLLTELGVPVKIDNQAIPLLKAFRS